MVTGIKYFAPFVRIFYMAERNWQVHDIKHLKQAFYINDSSPHFSLDHPKK